MFERLRREHAEKALSHEVEVSRHLRSALHGALRETQRLARELESALRQNAALRYEQAPSPGARGDGDVSDRAAMVMQLRQAALELERGGYGQSAMVRVAAVYSELAGGRR